MYLNAHCRGILCKTSLVPAMTRSGRDRWPKVFIIKIKLYNCQLVIVSINVLLYSSPSWLRHLGPHLYLIKYKFSLRHDLINTYVLFIKNGPPSYSINVVAAVILKNPSYLEDTEKCILNKVDQKRVQQVCILVNITLLNVSTQQESNIQHQSFPAQTPAFSNPVTLTKIQNPEKCFPRDSAIPSQNLSLSCPVSFPLPALTTSNSGGTNTTSPQSYSTAAAATAATPASRGSLMKMKISQRIIRSVISIALPILLTSLKKRKKCPSVSQLPAVPNIFCSKRRMMSLLSQSQS